MGLRACMLKLKIKYRSLCLLQVNAPNAVSEYQAFVDDVNDAHQSRVANRAGLFGSGSGSGRVRA